LIPEFAGDGSRTVDRADICYGEDQLAIKASDRHLPDCICRFATEAVDALVPINIATGCLQG